MAGLAAVLAACYSPSAQVGAPCSPGGECPAGQHCNQQVTPPTCEAADARPADAAPDGPLACATSASCPAAAPVCDMTSQTCRGCQADTECDAGICAEHVGQCISEANVLFVAASGTDGGACTRTDPCATLTYVLGLVANNKRTIAIGDGTYAPAVQIKAFGANSLTLSGPDRDPAGVSLTGGVLVDAGAKNVLIEGVTIASSGGRAVDNRSTLALSRVALTGAGTGLVSQNQYQLQIHDCAITGNQNIGVDISQSTVEMQRTVVANNGGGGISVSNAATTIESSIIAHNGGVFAPFGGVRYQNLNGRPQVFRFNTVANNTTSLGANGVICPTSLALESSIFVGDPSAGAPVAGIACAPIYSLFATPPPAGTGNVTGDPAFAGADDFHIGPTSAARDAADPAATVTLDIDGEVRPQGPGRDIGADEIP